jgi:RimK-like ATP-grasp domain
MSLPDERLSDDRIRRLALRSEGTACQLEIHVSDQNTVTTSPVGARGSAAVADDTLSLYWIWPERFRLGTMLADEEVWRVYGDEAAEQGLEMHVISVDDITVAARPDGPTVLVRGDPIDRSRSAFHGKLYTWPSFSSDIWRSLTVFQVIEEAGYCNLIRPSLNLITNDKAATVLHLRDVDQRWLPTIRLTTRDPEAPTVPLKEAGITYPVVAKPTSWGGGNGVLVAHDEAELMTALRLASAAELSMVIQPLVEPPLEDVRVFCVNGDPVGAIRRTPAEGGVVANTGAGGRAEFIPIPAELHQRASAIAARLDAPWLGVDFLGGNGDYYLSEVEIDACTHLPGRTRMPDMDRIMTQRFAGYRQRFERWRASRDAVTV